MLVLYHQLIFFNGSYWRKYAMAQPVGYIQITKAVRRQNSIYITYACEQKSLVQICIAGNGHKTSKLAKHIGSDCQVAFRFSQDAEADLYNSAYLEDMEGNRIGVEIPILQGQDNEKNVSHRNSVRREPIRTQEYLLPKNNKLSKIWIAKYVGIALGIFIGLSLIFYACSSPIALKSFIIQEAFFQDGKNIIVMGEIVWNPDIPISVRNSPKHEIKLQLFCDGVASGTEQKVFYDNFRLSFPYISEIGKKKNYTIGVQYQGKWKEPWERAVDYHPGHPIAQLAKISFDSQQKIIIQVSVAYNQKNELFVALAHVIDKEEIGAVIDTQNLGQNTSVALGPIPNYGNFWVLLRTQDNKILDQQKVTPTVPLAKITTSSWTNLSAITIRGFWDGPPELTGIPLFCMDIETKYVVASATQPKTFQHTFQIPDIRHNYQVYLQYHDTILAQTFVAKPMQFQEYIQILDEIGPWLIQYDRAIQNLTNEPNIPQALQQLQEIALKATQYNQTCQQVLLRSRPEDEVAIVQKLYMTLAELSQIVLAAQQRLPNQQRAELWNEILRLHYNDLNSQMILLQNIVAEFRTPPVKLPILPYFESQLQHQQQSLKIEKWIQHISSCVQSGQYELGIDLCTQAARELPDVWQFLWARYQIYRILIKTCEYPHRLPLYQRKANEDQNQVLQLLREKFNANLNEQNYGEAYVIGSHLLQIKPDSSIQQKMDEIKSRVPLETLVSVYRQSPKISFSLESLEKQ